MKILITTHTYAPNSDGVQFVTQYLSEGLVKKGNEVTVLTNMYPNRSSIKEENINGVNIIRINVKTKYTIHIGNRKEYIKFIKNLVKDYDIMINICTQTALTDWILPYLDELKIYKVLYVHSIWDFKYRNENFYSLKSFFSKIISNIRWRLYYLKNSNNFKKYNRVIQLHKMDYSYKFFKDKLNINSDIIENAAEDIFFKEEYNKSIDLPKNYIINVSNYSERKNQIQCVKAFIESNIPSDWELILIGSRKNKYFKKINDYYNDYKLHNKNYKKVRFLYSIPREEISTYVKKAKIYIMSSKWEGFPISLVEAMAAGVPFISTNVGVVRFFSGGVIADNFEEFKYLISKFTNDEKLCLLYGEAGKYEAEKRYMISEKVEILEKIIIEILNNNDNK